MLEYKLLRLLLNPHRIKYYYELESVLEYLDVNHHYDSNEDLYNVFYNLKGTNDKFDELSPTEKKLVYESVTASSAYNNWVAAYEKAEKYRKLSAFNKFWIRVNTAWLNLTELPRLMLSNAKTKLHQLLDYQTKVKVTFKDQQQRIDNTNALISKVNERIDLIEAKVFRKKKAKKSAKKKNIKSN
jgi:hypothetical protein